MLLRAFALGLLWGTTALLIGAFFSGPTILWPVVIMVLCHRGRGWTEQVLVMLPVALLTVSFGGAEPLPLGIAILVAAVSQDLLERSVVGSAGLEAIGCSASALLATLAISFLGGTSQPFSLMVATTVTTLGLFVAFIMMRALAEILSNLRDRWEEEL